MQTRTEPVPRSAPFALWRIAEAFLHVLHDLFGAPEDVAARHTLTRSAHALMASWIRVGEALLLRLLMIEAAAIEAVEVTYTHSRQSPQPEPTSQGACTSPRSPRTLRTFFADDPESWRVAFRCFAAADRRLPAGNSPNKPIARASQDVVCRLEAGGPRFRSAWPLAERYEAMLRVFNAPFAYARRLARRLRTQPQRAGALLRAPPEYQHRVDRAADLTDEARRAWRGPDSS